MGKHRKFTTVEFQDNLGRAIYDSGLTDVALAKRMKRGRRTIASWRNGETPPSIVDFMQLCDILKVEPDVLYFGRKVHR